MMDSMSPLEPVDPNVPRLSTHKQKMETQPQLLSPSAEYGQTENNLWGLSSNGSISPNLIRRPSLTGQPSFSRPRKRLTWRNKACIIALPLEDENGRRTTRTDYLKPEHVAQRLRMWEEEGFNTSGFVLAPSSFSDVCGSQGQSRSLHPDPVDLEQERKTTSSRVLIPNKQEFEARQAELREEKLRSLGVTIGDGDALSRRSPVPSLMSRQASSQSSAMVASPNLHATFVSSNFESSIQHGTGPTSKPGVAHFPRYSVASPFSDKNNTQIQNSLIHAANYRHPSPMGYALSPPGSRIASPSIHEQLSSPFTVAMPRVVPQTSSSRPGASIPNVPQRKPGEDADHKQRSEQPPFQTLHSDALGTSNYSESFLSNEGHKTALVTPTPRSHRQNPSESLQREVEEAEAYLDQLDDEVNESTTRSRGNENNQTSTEPRETESIRALGEIKPSSTILPHPDELGSMSDSSMAVVNSRRSQHSSRSSISKLNVNAPEFKFEPKSTLQPDVFAFLPDQHQNKNGQPPFHSGGLRQHDRKASVARPLPKLNAAAPAWTPATDTGKPRPSRVFSFGNLTDQRSDADVPSEKNSRQFSFSARPPSLNPDAPSFTPSLQSHDEQPPSKSVESKEDRIFDNVSLANVVKPSKQSKALPIVKPDATSNDSDTSEGPEDESGRITQPDTRQKRLRRDDLDGDQIPQFAPPTVGVWSDRQRQEISPISDSSTRQDLKEVPTLAATNLLEELVDDMTASDSSGIPAPQIISRSQSYDRRHFSPRGLQSSQGVNGLSHRSIGSGSQSAESLRPNDSDSPTLSSQSKKRRTSQRSSKASTPSSNSAGAIKGVNEFVRKTSANDVSRPREDILQGIRYIDPPYDEIDSVMNHLNQDGNSDLGIERGPSPQRASAAETQRGRSPRVIMQETVKRQLLPPAHIRSDAPSPSPNRLHEPFQYLRPSDSESRDSAVARFVEDNAPYSPSYRPSRASPRVHRLNSPGSTPPSDWNDAFSSVDETWLKSKTGHSNGQLQVDIGAIVQHQLKPFEKSLARIHDSIGLFSKAPLGGTAGCRPLSSSTYEIEHSDADDEDETQDVPSARRRSAVRDRKIDQLKGLVNEIASIQQKSVSTDHIAQITSTLNDLKASINDNAQSLHTNVDVKKVVDEAINRQMRGKSVPVISSTQAAAAEKSQLQISGLESMLKVAEGRAEDEMKARRATEDALADNQRLLRQALQEAAQQRESVEAIEAKIQEFNEERQHSLRHAAVLEGSQESLEKTTIELEEKNQALESTLAEYRLSHEQWRTDMSDMKNEKKDFQKQVQNLEVELDKVNDGKHALKAIITELKDKNSQASALASEDLMQWRRTTIEHKSRLDLLSARLEAGARTRERLEVEIERLEAQEKESMKARFQAEQTHRANAHLDQVIGKLRTQLQEGQHQNAHLQKELVVSKQAANSEVHKIRSAAEVDMQSARHKAQSTQHELQGTIARLEKRLENEACDAAGSQSQSAAKLFEALESRKAALHEASELRSAALDEQAHYHSRTLEHLKAEQQGALEDILEKERRSQHGLAEQLRIADETTAELQAKVISLEESLKISKAAAQAAVQAVQTSKTSADPSKHTLASDSKAELPEKISPQALRESILVLQEQLQARESTVEDLEARLANVDLKAPEKLREAEVETAWLRELLGVRMDDLQDIINALSQPSFHKEAVRDAAIRLQANLQMEQQEKERLHGRPQGLQFVNIAHIAASPKALPMAAAAAWSNWRKRRDFGSENTSGRAYNPDETPSKQTSSPHSSLSGLLTPPSTSLRASSSNPASGYRPSSSSNPPLTPSPQKKRLSRPTTPPLLRQTSYDLDAAEATVFGKEYNVDDTHDYNLSEYEVQPEEEPFGPRIGTFGGQ